MADDDPPKGTCCHCSLRRRGMARELAAPLVERYTQMQTKIAELEKALAELPQIPAQPAPTGGMGHNNPPEPLEPADIDEIKADIQVLKTQTASHLTKAQMRFRRYYVSRPKLRSCAVGRATGRGTCVGSDEQWGSR